MRLGKSVNLDFFLIDPEQEEELTPPLPVKVPQTAFMIHPSRMVGPVYLWRKDKVWHLVNPTLVSNGDVTEASAAYLFEGIQLSGESFLLPLTFPKREEDQTWHDSLREVVDEARKYWIKRIPNSDECIHVPIKLKHQPDVEPSWPKWSVDDWMSKAFAHRQVIHAPKKKYFVVVEDDE